MKRSFITLLCMASIWMNAQINNTLLDNNFWKNKPDLQAVETEIKKGNSPNEFNDNKFDAVTVAILNEAPLETIKYLLKQKGNDINKLTHDNRIYLHWAALKGNTELIKYLIDKKSNINLEDSHGLTPLVFAANAGQTDVEIYRLFFDAGLNPKQKYKNGATILLLAIPYDSDLHLSDYLQSKGLSLLDTDDKGSTAFDYAARKGDIELLKKLKTRGVKSTNNALLLAAEATRRTANTLDVFKYLVEDIKLNPLVVNDDLQTVLHIVATKPDQAEIINYFISKKVDPQKKDKEGNTAFIKSASGKDIKNTQVFLPLVKNINEVNNKGESALMLAVKSSTPEMIALLLANGANIIQKDNKGNSLVYYLIQSYHPRNKDFDANLELLKDKGVDFNAKQEEGNTLYHLAVGKNDINLIKKISGLKVDVNTANNEGITPLQRAAMIAKDDTILKYLLSLGAKKDLKTEFGETAYDLAKENKILTQNKVSVDFLK
ncbi:ankyrin repeat domain-containing protein [Apibacter sp. B2966]|uniref:ankyrin repeat domain-containing protein n=1 Tax=Apibacter sp. B2966 TaxID=2656761 RepID=UPI0014095741|nr:ankyrin repeat domain-containing protein [Apibacter sp. B2966]QII72050.1 ankyrin repeat domain-containing protein [Apibacter sp. B2966]